MTAIVNPDRNSFILPRLTKQPSTDWTRKAIVVGCALRTSLLFLSYDSTFLATEIPANASTDL